MTIYDEIEIEDMDFDDSDFTFYYNCPCGDRFSVSLDELIDGEDIAECPSCTLQIRVIFEKEDLQAFNFNNAKSLVVC